MHDPVVILLNVKNIKKSEEILNVRKVKKKKKNYLKLGIQFLDIPVEIFCQN